MLDKRDYLIHFARIFFACLLLIVFSFFTHIWNKYQPFHLAVQIQRCQSNLSDKKILSLNVWKWLSHFHIIEILPTIPFLSTSISSKCHSHIEENYPLNIHQYLRLIYSILLIYLVYHLICLSAVHTRMKQLEEKQRYYGRLYRQDENVRCSKRLLKT
ncbi:hypothetical protein I4U23_014378 [Adineta vaga]|nr:hypothetical protein I4U23_014378 [Adineta vaga]